MKKVSMKTLLATIVAALFITLFFVGGVYCLYTQVADPALFIVALGSAWAVSLWLLLSTVFSKRRKGSVSFHFHDRSLLVISFQVSFTTYHITHTIITSMIALPPTLMTVFMY